jgi:para-aminobenzoate synthetase/4-amino-4-deoxychorismate lyase
MLVILDSVGGRQVFQKPRALIRANSADQVPAALAAMEAARAAGHWLAGAFAYELGYALEPKLASLMPSLLMSSPMMPPGADGAPLPLILFGVYDAPSATAPPAVGRAYAGPLKPEWDAAEYDARFRAVKAALAAGDIYQANLSFRAAFAFAGNPRALYEQLRASSAAPYCAFLDFLDEKMGAHRQILSLSPELFFDIKADLIRARPMKGTAARHGDDDAERAALAASPKDRAENLMIVDLIRNDLGRIAQIGSVGVQDLYAVETYPTLHTMVSTVTAQLRPGTDIAALARALFPCGSITGAPKIRAMEILRQLETSRRGAYCGAMGYFAPGGSALFNVAIRTLTLCGDSGALGIGGGVVQDSDAASEYAECLLKARFFEDPRRPLELIETLKWENGFVRLERHLARMAASALVFGLAFDPAQARQVLADIVAGGQGVLRVRLALNEAGAFQVTAAPLAENPPHWAYSISPQRLDSADLLLRHKISWRELYDAPHPGDEVIFRNERGEVAEGARSNIFVRRGGKLLTPPHSAGLLPGILRAELLESGQCEEVVLTENDLEGEVLFGNSLRGLIPAIRA